MEINCQRLKSGVDGSLFDSRLSVWIFQFLYLNRFSLGIAAQTKNMHRLILQMMSMWVLFIYKWSCDGLVSCPGYFTPVAPEQGGGKGAILAPLLHSCLEIAPCNSVS